MHYINIYRNRIEQFIKRVYAARYSRTTPFAAKFTYDQDRPIPLSELDDRCFTPIRVGEQWGKQWGSAWFVFEGVVPDSFAGAEVVALIDVGGEACVFVDGEPERGLTHKKLEEGPHLKRRVPVSNPARAGESVSILVEAAANGLFGAESDGVFRLMQAELAVFRRDLWQLALDLQVLLDIAESLPEDSPRTQKILYGLNRTANLWRDGRGLAECKAITEELLAVPAHASDMTIYSVGHAHIDLGWLWPVRETKRKGGRTFATALRMMEEYPDYVFGASQPQLYQWIKEEYPRLYAQIKRAVAGGRWECQGAMWVEPDMNITGGESLVRQCLYGKTFYRQEFGKEVRNLWLPDVFGYSAALPQILRKSGVEVFMTQKISWNETNVFPHHTFLWQGIDGTEILTHFLPTNNYNLSNTPSELIESQKRFAHLDSQDAFLNLYGTGDGGGGPSRLHIERALRLQNTEGVPMVKLAFADEFFARIASYDRDSLPRWVGELYLELHRGTLTTQGRMKRYNRLLERELRDVEILGVLAEAESRASYPKKELDDVWKETLLNQFHDILPGSSIARVYEEAYAVSERNLGVLAELRRRSVDALFGTQTGEERRTTPARFVLLNTLSWERSSVVALPLDDGAAAVVVRDASGNPLPSARTEKGVLVAVTLPSLGYTTVTVESGEDAETGEEVVRVREAGGETMIENELVRVTLAADGCITSILDRGGEREYLSGAANRLLLWEDLPYAWDAWDVSHYYRETEPEQARLVERRVHEATPLRATVYQKLVVGRSTIEQWIRLCTNSMLVEIENLIEWSEEQKLLKVHAQTAVKTTDATYEIQYGTLRRPTHRNTHWDHARFEVAGQRFADLSQPDYGLALLNDCKYGYSVYDNSVELSLLRAPTSPDPTADRGVHEITYAYLPHPDDFPASRVFETAHELNDPVTVASVVSLPNVRERSWFAVAGGPVKIEVVKRAESGSGTVVRLYETRGTDARIELSTELSFSHVYETDLLERSRTPIGGSGPIALAFGPFEIKTILFE